MRVDGASNNFNININKRVEESKISEKKVEEKKQEDMKSEKSPSNLDVPKRVISEASVNGIGKNFDEYIYG